MPNSPYPGMPQTATKANVGSLVSAAVTLVLYAIGRLTGIVEIPDSGVVQEAVIGLVTFGVTWAVSWLAIYLPSNKPVDSAGNPMRTHPLVTCAAIGITLVLLGSFLSGCAPSGGAAQPADTSGVQKNIAYAEGYVAVGKAAAATCIALKLPVCSSPAFADGVARATAVADEAIAEAKSYPINGTTQDKINAALRVAMNAVLLFYSLK
ncbi:hypothetical protein [Inquilinus sp.]|uniref:hypothetical protein n=1 Tax=Inquilinus sp. TaxID=1932117 RepID=UPI0031D1489A